MSQARRGKPIHDKTLDGKTCYRIWIVERGNWVPKRWCDVPPRAEAVRPAEPQLMSLEHAQEYIKGFNTEMGQRGHRYWAVMVPVEICLHGDFVSGKQVRPRRMVFRHDAEEISRSRDRHARRQRISNPVHDHRDGISSPKA